MDVADRILYLENGRIMGDYTPEQFQLLPAEKRQRMGLRAINLQEEKPMCVAAASQLPVLELKAVSLTYKKQSVLNNISLQAAHGDVIAVVGHNGAGKTLEELGLAAFHERHPNTLSGGQKQRLAAATSMVCRKELLVFDEPTSGLDYGSMVRLAALIQRLSGLGKIIFIVTHDYEFVCRTCTRVLHLDDGGIQDDLSVTEELFSTIKKIFDVR